MKKIFIFMFILLLIISIGFITFIHLNKQYDTIENIFNLQKHHINLDKIFINLDFSNLHMTHPLFNEISIFHEEFHIINNRLYKPTTIEVVFENSDIPHLIEQLINIEIKPYSITSQPFFKRTLFYNETFSHKPNSNLILNFYFTSNIYNQNHVIRFTFFGTNFLRVVQGDRYKGINESFGFNPKLFRVEYNHSQKINDLLEILQSNVWDLLIYEK